MGITPNLGVANFWACAVGRDRPLVMAIDHAAPLPTSEHTLGLTGEGFSVEQSIVAPFEEFAVTYSVDAEAHEDPRAVYRKERGKPTRLEAELTWRSVAAPFPYPAMTRYELPCLVTGTVTVDGETVTVDGQGERDHSWGRRDWWEIGWCWTSGRLDDGTWFHGMRPTPEFFEFEPGFLRTAASPDLVVASQVKPRYAWGDDGLPVGTGLAIDDLDFEVTPLFYAPVLLTAPDARTSHFARALCRYDEIGGASRTAYGWTEWNLPPTP